MDWRKSCNILSPGLRCNLTGHVISPVSAHIQWQESRVSPQERQAHFRHEPATFWLTGLPGSGKSTLAYALEKKLMDTGHAVYVLDGDNVRHGLSRDLGFTETDRSENIRRVAEVARLFNDAGLLVITAFISPYEQDRALAKSIIGEARFFEVHVAATLDVCEQRDPKGFYARARTGEISGFTGVSAPYQTPRLPAVSMDTGADSVEQSIEKLWTLVEQRFR